jgi:competence protein ComEC
VVRAARRGLGPPGVAAPGAPPPPADAAPAGPGMRIYWIDVEGGAATLLVSPAGETFLVDAGWSGSRDRDRIVSVLEKEVGKKQVDYFVATHYHGDHIGGIGELASAVPIMNFIDHGNSVEGGDGEYRGAIGPMKRRSVRPGDKIMLGAVEITVVTAGGQVVSALPGALPNPMCTGAQTKSDQQDEDPQSVGVLARFGKFEFVDLGDLTWGVEHRLACPMNRLGQVEIFQSSQHGSTESNPPQLVHALAPQAIVVNCGASKGGSSGALQVFRGSPGIKDVWQVHHAAGAGAANSEDALIANPAGADNAHWIRATIEPSGAFQITNGRTGLSRSYQSR